MHSINTSDQRSYERLKSHQAQFMVATLEPDCTLTQCSGEDLEVTWVVR